MTLAKNIRFVFPVSPDTSALHMHSPNKGVINKTKPQNKISEKTLKNGQNKLSFRF